MPLEEFRNETDYAQLLVLPQSKTERLLAAALARQPTAQLRFGCEVTAVAPEGAGLPVRYRQEDREQVARARFVVGSIVLAGDAALKSKGV